MASSARESGGLGRGGCSPLPSPPGFSQCLEGPRPLTLPLKKASLPPLPSPCPPQPKLAPAHGPTGRPVPAYAADRAPQAALGLELPQGCPPTPCSFSCLRCTSLGSLQPPGPPITPRVKPRPLAPTTSPRAGLTSAQLPSRTQEAGQAGLLRGCGASSFYTCSHQACLQLGLQLSLHPSRGLQPGTGGPQGLPGTWHVHTGLGRPTISSAWPP